MKNLPVLFVIITALMLFNCTKKQDSPIPYDQYIDCSVSATTGIIADSLNTTVQIDLKNHSANDLSLDYLYVQVVLTDSISHKWYGCSILEFKSNHGDTYSLKQNSIVSISKNINELVWNSYYKTTDLPAGNYRMGVNVATGNLDVSGNAIFSNGIWIRKK